MTTNGQHIEPKRRIADLFAAYDREITSLPSGPARRAFELRKSGFRERLVREIDKRGATRLPDLSERDQEEVVMIMRLTMLLDFEGLAERQSDDPRITDEVVRAAVAAGLKAPPRIEDFCRAMLGAALPLIKPAPVAALAQPAPPVQNRELLRRSRDFANALLSETVVREHRNVIAARVHDFVEGILNPERGSAPGAAGLAPAERAGVPGDDHGLYFSDDEGSGA